MKVKKTKNPTAYRLAEELMGQKWRILIVLSSVITSAILGILYPHLMAEAINQIVAGVQDAMGTGAAFQLKIETTGRILLALFAIFVFRGMVGYVGEYVMAGVAQNLSLSMRKKISDKLNRLPLSFYDRSKKGEILSRTTSDMEKVADTLQEGLSQLLNSVVGITGSIAMMLVINKTLTVVVLITVFFSMAAAAIISHKTEQCHRENQRALGEYNAGIEEAFTGNLVVKGFNLQDKMVESAMRMSEHLCKTGKRAQFITYVINPVIRFLNHLGYIAAAVGGAILVIQGKMSIGYIQAFFQYISKVAESVMALAFVVNSMQGAVAAGERVYQLLDEEEEAPDEASDQSVSNPKGTVCFEHVRFGYDDENILMEDINIEVKAGSKVAIVGPTGAGKTTFVNLLMRFYELKGGTIRIDGEDITDMSRKELRSMIGMVLQDTWLFNGTAADNLSYGKPGASEDEIRQAAVAAKIDHFIRTLPHGYETVLDNEAAVMSEGQKQLFTIARAILANPVIMVLDEATSSVDTRTESEIQQAMNRLMEGKTSFIIAHRLSTIRDADQILVMDKGTIVEQGSHEELMERNGFYTDLYNSQFQRSFKQDLV